jgi:hypothetical protein
MSLIKVDQLYVDTDNQTITVLGSDHSEWSFSIQNLLQVQKGAQVGSSGGLDVPTARRKPQPPVKPASKEEIKEVAVKEAKPAPVYKAPALKTPDVAYDAGKENYGR